MAMQSTATIAQTEENRKREITGDGQDEQPEASRRRRCDDSPPYPPSATPFKTAQPGGSAAARPTMSQGELSEAVHELLASKRAHEAWMSGVDDHLEMYRSQIIHV